jgi:hypothetical protein
MNLEARWAEFSLLEQIGHVTSELTRARIWEDRGDETSRQQALKRALDLIDMSLSRRGSSLREWARLRELVCDCLLRSNIHGISLGDLERFGLLHFVR